MEGQGGVFENLGGDMDSDALSLLDRQLSSCRPRGGDDDGVRDDPKELLGIGPRILHQLLVHGVAGDIVTQSPLVALVPSDIILRSSDSASEPVDYSLLDIGGELLVVECAVLDHFTSCPIHLQCNGLELVTNLLGTKGNGKVGGFVDGLARGEGSHLMAVDGGVADIWDPVGEALKVDLDASAVVGKLPAGPIELDLLFAFEALFFEEGGGELL